MIGNGVVIDPWALLEEIDRIEEQGVKLDPSRLKIAENAPLILPLHCTLDQAREEARGKAKIGTTGRGIGPAYEDKTARRAIRVCDLADLDSLGPRSMSFLCTTTRCCAGLGKRRSTATS